MKFKSLLSFVLILFATASTAAGKPLDSYRMATVDVNRVMNELEDARALKKKLDSRSETARTRVTKEREELQKLEATIKSKGLSEDSPEFDEFRSKARDFERMVKDTEEDLRREFLKDNQQLTEKVLSAVKKYAEKNDIHLVLDKSQPGRGPVLFGDPAADITSELIKSLND